MTLSDRLQRLLSARGLSVGELARRAGMEKMQAWRIVSGKVPDPRLSSVERLVTAAGGTLAELFSDLS